MSRKQARLELKIITPSDHTRAAKRFHDWHSRYDRTLDGMSLENATKILQELGRSMADSPSSHALWRSTRQALVTIREWKRNHEGWKDTPTPIPYLQRANLSRLLCTSTSRINMPSSRSRACFGTLIFIGTSFEHHRRLGGMGQNWTTTSGVRSICSRARTPKLH